jgi:type II secretion system protein I
MRRFGRGKRSGLTLLEILLAIAIFFGAMATLSQLAWNGTRATVQARLKTQAIIRCETKLTEILAGIEPLGPKSNVPFPDNASWTYSTMITETNFPELLQIDVTVSHSGNNRLSNSTFTLRRWTRDPSAFMSAALVKKEGSSQ